MTEAIRAMLRRSLLASYRELTARLTRRLGSPDLASEALHETWLRLERSANLTPVANPDAYLYRTALNTAANLRVAEDRRLSAVEIEAIMELPDEAPDAARVADARFEIARLEAALTELPERQRAVFYEALLEDLSYEQLAERHGVTVRTIHRDIGLAIGHCAARLGKERLFTLGRRQLSNRQKGAQS